MNSRYDKWNGMNGSHTHAHFTDLWPDFLSDRCHHSHSILRMFYLYIWFCVCFFYFIVSLSIFCLFVLCLKNSNKSRIHEAMSACMAKIISHITELLFGTSPKKIYAMWPFQGREYDHQILFSTFHQSYQNHRISFNFAVFRSFNRNTYLAIATKPLFLHSVR